MLVNANFQYSDDIEIHINTLERTLGYFRDCKVVFTMDSNAKPMLWYAQATKVKVIY